MENLIIKSIVIAPRSSLVNEQIITKLKNEHKFDLYILENDTNLELEEIISKLKKENIDLNYVMLMGNDNFKEKTVKNFTYSYKAANLKEEVLPYYNFYSSRYEQDALEEAIVDYLYRIKHILFTNQTKIKLDKQKIKGNY
ncbi:hypothetical protein ACLRE7_02940 [Mycoplasmopsis meleagridis]|uniref:hypothetical protein n=1 Tax=Mycoplasmopsis meleagridis TaxID=29561 RepID=UPI003A88430B